MYAFALSGRVLWCCGGIPRVSLRFAACPGLWAVAPSGRASYAHYQLYMVLAKLKIM